MPSLPKISFSQDLQKSQTLICLPIVAFATGLHAADVRRQTFQTASLNATVDLPALWNSFWQWYGALPQGWQITYGIVAGVTVITGVIGSIYWHSSRVNRRWESSASATDIKLIVDFLTSAKNEGLSPQGMIELTMLKIQVETRLERPEATPLDVTTDRLAVLISKLIINQVNINKRERLGAIAPDVWSTHVDKLRREAIANNHVGRLALCLAALGQEIDMEVKLLEQITAGVEAFKKEAPTFFKGEMGRVLAIAQEEEKKFAEGEVARETQTHNDAVTELREGIRRLLYRINNDYIRHVDDAEVLGDLSDRVQRVLTIAQSVASDLETISDSLKKEKTLLREAEQHKRIEVRIPEEQKDGTVHYRIEIQDQSAEFFERAEHARSEADSAASRVPVTIEELGRALRPLETEKNFGRFGSDMTLGIRLPSSKKVYGSEKAAMDGHAKMRPIIDFLAQRKDGLDKKQKAEKKSAELLVDKHINQQMDEVKGNPYLPEEPNVLDERLYMTIQPDAAAAETGHQKIGRRKRLALWIIGAFLFHQGITHTSPRLLAAS